MIYGCSEGVTVTGGLGIPVLVFQESCGGGGVCHWMRGYPTDHLARDVLCLPIVHRWMNCVRSNRDVLGRVAAE